VRRVEDSAVKSIESIRAQAAQKRAEAIERARKSGKDWRRTVGWAKNDPVFEEAMRLGAEWRESENRKSLEETDRSDAHP
jgi:hypothetical protein